MNVFFDIAFYRIKLPKRVFIFLTFTLYCSGQTDSLNSLTEPDNTPEVTFYIQKTGKTFFLNQFLPHNDSCGNLEIHFEKPAEIRALFKCDNMHTWSVDTILYTNSALQHSYVTTTTSKDAGGNLQKMRICYECEPDSSPIDLNIPKTTDIPVQSIDTSVVPVSYSIRRSVFLCNDSSTEKPKLRVFDYPPGYMRREPVPNYPKLSMFHYGGSVKIPTNESIRLKGFMMNYWHLLNPPEVEYGGTMREIRGKTKKANVKRKHFFTIKPIH